MDYIHAVYVHLGVSRYMGKQEMKTDKQLQNEINGRARLRRCVVDSVRAWRCLATLNGTIFKALSGIDRIEINNQNI